MATRFNTNHIRSLNTAFTHTTITILDSCIHKLTAIQDHLKHPGNTRYKPIEHAAKRLQDRINNDQEFESTTNILEELATEHGFEPPR